MRKILFLLCPTDFLESRINQVYYESGNYFYTSLGNSFNVDFKTLKGIKESVIKHSINEINFVLSSRNKIVLDALEGQFFSEISGLKKFYQEIIIQKKHSESWQQSNTEFLILSYYLNNKIKELEGYLSDLPCLSTHIKGQIYNENKNTFKPIYSGLICVENYQLN